MYVKEETHACFCWGNLRERDRSGYPSVDDGRIIVWRIFRMWCVRALTGSSWIRIVKVGGHVWMR